MKQTIRLSSFFKKYNLVSFLFCFLFFASIFSCNFFIENGGLGTSLSIEDSKERSVFINEYKAVKNPYKINDSLSITVKSAWLEYQWRYSGQNSEKAEIIENNYQLIIITDKQSLKGYNDSWFIGSKYTDKDAFFNGYDNNIIINLDTLPKKNMIEWNVQSLSKQNRISKTKFILGKFSLEKCDNASDK